LDELCVKLTETIKALLINARTKLTSGYEQIVKIEPHRLLGKKTVDLNNLKNRTYTAIKTIVNKNRIQLTDAASRLAALNPKSVLQRGYSITTSKKTGLLIKTPEDVQINDFIITELAPPAMRPGLAQKNLIESKVTKK